MKKRAKNRSSVNRKTTNKRSRTAKPAKSSSGAIRLWWVTRGLLAGLVIVVSLAALAYAADIVMRLPAVAVKHIDVSGYLTIKPEKIIEISGIRPGQPILKVDLGSVKKRVIMHPQISDAAVVRDFPDTIHINIVERRPVALIMQDGFFEVDQDGVVLGVRGRYSGSFPIITGVRGRWQVGEVADDALVGLLVLDALKRSSLAGVAGVSEIALKKDGRAVVSLMKTGTVLIMTPGGAEQEIKRMARMIDSHNFDVNAAGYDLRFDGRVVKLPESAENSGG